MKFHVHLSSSAQKFLEKADEITYQRIVKRLERLSEDPFPLEAKRVMGRVEKVFRVRVGDYRILYVVYLDKRVVLITHIDKRPRVYRK